MSEVMGKNVTVILPTCNRYQTARLVAAQQLIPRLTIIEISGVGSYNIPGWRAPEADQLPFVQSLFRNKTFHEIGTAELRRELHAHLSAHKAGIDSVAILGWGNRDALCALEWAAGNGVPVITMSESQIIDEVRSSWKEAIKRQLVGCFSAGLAGGTSHAAYLVELGLPADTVFLGYDVVDNNFFANGAQKVRESEGKDENASGLPENFFLASARFIGKKNLSRLVEAYARYRHLTLPSEPWSLVLLGDGPLRETIESQISALGLHDNVVLPGFKQYLELPAYYGRARAFIHASTAEQWGLVVNEAMACGLPVLVSNRCGCAADLVKDGVNGFTFDPFNVEEMAKCMAKLSSSDRAGFSGMAAASLRIVAEWGPKRFAEGFLAATRKALETGARGGSFVQRLLLRLMLRN